MSKRKMIDLVEFLEKKYGLKLRDLTVREIEELIKELEKLPPEMPIINIED